MARDSGSVSAPGMLNTPVCVDRAAATIAATAVERQHVEHRIEPQRPQADPIHRDRLARSSNARTLARVPLTTPRRANSVLTNGSRGTK
jgi:hypothetical protein